MNNSHKNNRIEQDTMLKTHNCGELTEAQIGRTVTLAGWVNRRRDHGGLIFIDLRDRFGITQVTIDSETSPQAHAIASAVRSEYVNPNYGDPADAARGIRKPEPGHRHNRSRNH